MADGRAYSYSGKAMTWQVVVTIVLTLAFATVSAASNYTGTFSVSVQYKYLLRGDCKVQCVRQGYGNA
jgi:hypothetical protein